MYRCCLGFLLDVVHVTVEQVQATREQREEELQGVGLLERQSDCYKIRLP